MDSAAAPPPLALLCIRGKPSDQPRCFLTVTQGKEALEELLTAPNSCVTALG